jgi:hypothetical protein
MKDLKIAICTLTCELDHLEEWIVHHINYGFQYFLICADTSRMKDNEKNIAIDLQIDLQNKFKGIKLYNYENYINKNSELSVQRQFYQDCTKDNLEYDYILYTDSDEYYESKTKNVIEDINLIKHQYGNFDCLGIFWRFYGCYPPFETRVSIESYKKFVPNNNLKCLINPKTIEENVDSFLNHHVPKLKKGSIRIDENGATFKHNPEHYSSVIKIWLKHIFTRSREEWKNKINRQGWYEGECLDWPRNMELFDKYNKDIEDQSKWYKEW